MKTIIENQAVMKFSSMFRCCLKIVSVPCLCAWLVVSLSTEAAEIPHDDQAIVVNARELSVELFLSELFGQIGVPVRVGDEVVGSVNGDFRGPARDVINNILSTFQLAVYYDGAVAHVYPSNDLVHKVMYMPGGSAREIQRAAQKLGMLDPHNTVSAADVGLVVTGAQRFVDQVERLVSAMRKTTLTPVNSSEIYRSFQLNYAWADDMSIVVGGREVVMPGVASIIRTIIGPGALANTPTDTAGSQGDLNTGDVQDPQVLASLTPASQGSTPGSNRGGRQAGSDTANTRIVADPLTNSIIIRDRADRMQSYEELIKTLDKEPQMIEIEATIIDLDTEKMRELGVNWRAQSGNDQALLGNGTFTDELLNPGANVTPAGDGGWVSLVLGNRQQFMARINALEKQGAARIISKPHVMTLSNVEALLNTTSTFFVRLEGQDEVDLRDVTVGTTLRVTPHVYERGGRTQIKLRINIEDGAPSSQLIDQLPVIENSEVNTQAIIDVGQSLLIGGLVRESVGNGVSRVPLLGRIPVIGAMFRSQNKASTRTERMFLITPRVSSTREAGKRLDAPILYGSEADIILSAPGRMTSTRQTLSVLDESYPIELSLPQGDSLTVEQSAYVEPYQVVAPVVQQDTSTEAAEPRSLRDRLLRPQGKTTPISNPGIDSQPSIVRPVQVAEQPVVAASIHMLNEQSNDEWQDVKSVRSSTGSTALARAPATSRHEASQAAESLQAPASSDGWQVIGQ